MVLPLPVTEQTIRIERAGYTPWEREVKPSPEMRIQPALFPISAPAQGGELPPPKPWRLRSTTANSCHRSENLLAEPVVESPLWLNQLRWRWQNQPLQHRLKSSKASACLRLNKLD